MHRRGIGFFFREGDRGENRWDSYPEAATTAGIPYAAWLSERPQQPCLCGAKKPKGSFGRGDKITERERASRSGGARLLLVMEDLGRGKLAARSPFRFDAVKGNKGGGE